MEKLYWACSSREETAYCLRWRFDFVASSVIGLADVGMRTWSSFENHGRMVW